MISFKYINTVVIVVILLLLTQNVKSQSNNRSYIDSNRYKVLRVRPSSTDTSIKAWDYDHIIYYDPLVRDNKILLYLTGTGGTTKNVPANFFNVALEQGYRIIDLSFISSPGVSQVCVGNVLNSNVDCAAAFRQKRIYGNNSFNLISDEPQDAIVPRLVKLLQWLVKNDTSYNWAQYLSKNMLKPFWNKIAVSGQSQGGGMAEYLAQHEVLARVISFSGGWDYSDSKEKKIAGWYYNKAVTPIENWYAAYNINEKASVPLSEICTALRIPPNQIFALDKPFLKVRLMPGDNPYHVDGIRNTTYRPIWIKMLGSGL